MKRVLEYELYQFYRTHSLMEGFVPVGSPIWPDNWKDLDLWKELEKMGFEDITTPRQAINQTIMISNKKFPHMYPAGVVLQPSGYIRDKSARSGFIKSYKTRFTLNDMFLYIKDRWSKEYERMNPKNTGSLTQEQVAFINSFTSTNWKWNNKTQSVDVEGKVDIDLFEKSEVLETFKFGIVKGDFELTIGKPILNSIESFAPDSAKSVSIRSIKDYNGGLKSTKGFPQKIKDGVTIYSKILESLEGVPFDIKFLRTYYFDVSPYTVETALNLLDRDEKTVSLISTALTDERLDSYFKKNPLKIYLLDNYPDIKSGVLKRTKMRDLSKVGRNLDTGWI